MRPAASPLFFGPLLALGVLASPSVASAQGLVLRLPGLGPTSFTATNTTLVRYRGNNFDANTHDDDFFSLTERLDLAAQAAPWRLYLRVDGFSPWNHDTSCSSAVAESCLVQSNWRPERMSLRYQRGDFTVEAGDYYQVFGRGLALAFRKVDPIGLDTVLRGGRAEYEHDRLTVRAFGGLANPQNLDPQSLQIFPDPSDLLAGASLAARAGRDGDLEVAGHLVHTDFETDANTMRQDSVDVAGFRFEAPSLADGALSLYGEADVLRRRSRTNVRATGPQNETFDQTWGRAVYAAAQVISGRWTVLAEWKDYSRYLIAPTDLGGASVRDVARIYSSAPSLERDDQRILNNSNTRGGRVRVDYAFASSPWILTLNSVFYGWTDHYGDDNHLADPWDGTYGYLTSHTYFSVRRRSRPVPLPGGPGAPSGAAAAQSTGGANIASAGLGGAGVTRVSAGDYNLIASVGYRREFHAGTAPSLGGRAPDFQSGDIKHESIQADIDVAFPVGANDSIELRLDNRFERNYTFERLTGFNLDDLSAGVRGGLSVSWSHGLPLVVSATLRWDNTSRPVGEASFDNLPFGRPPDAAMPRLDPRSPLFYPSAEVRWNFTLSNFVRVFAGMTPGGRVCSGGVCRDVPLFQGAIAELVLRI